MKSANLWNEIGESVELIISFSVERQRVLAKFDDGITEPFL